MFVIFSSKVQQLQHPVFRNPIARTVGTCALPFVKRPLCTCTTSKAVRRRRRKSTGGLLHHFCVRNKSSLPHTQQQQKKEESNHQDSSITTDHHGFGFPMINVDEVMVREEKNGHDGDGDINSLMIRQLLKPYYEKQVPVVLKGGILTSNYKAIQKWQSLDYFLEHVSSEVMGNVEIGNYYSQQQGKQQTQQTRSEIPFVDYIQYIKVFEEKYGRYGTMDDPWSWWCDGDNENDAAADSGDDKDNSICVNPDEIIYMAQNDLFPSLYQDIIIPKLYHESDEGSSTNENNSNIGHGNLYNVMLWIGPRGCISPLHYDPLDNLLMQVSGRKRIVLFPPPNSTTKTNNSLLSETDTTTTNSMRMFEDDDDHTNWHYAANGSSIDEQMDAHNGINNDNKQHNMSPIDIEKIISPGSMKDDPNNYYTKKYPKFLQSAPFPAYHCIIHPGDILYIPQKWWHHVRSIDRSVSVNVWWR